VLSGGNFHGQPIALALDVIGIALTTLAGIAERRIERVVNPDLSSGLPAFLANDPGLESGFMTAQITAAALVADCRVLATPASVQSVPTEGNQEDVVPMGMSAAWKGGRILANAERIVAIELLVGAQGLEFLKPLQPSKAVGRLYAAIRKISAALSADRPLTTDIERMARGIRGDTRLGVAGDLRAQLRDHRAGGLAERDHDKTDEHQDQRGTPHGVATGARVLDRRPSCQRRPGGRAEAQAVQRRAGVRGSSFTSTPSGLRASATALARTAAGPSVPPSPTPRTPMRLSAGTSM